MVADAALLEDEGLRLLVELDGGQPPGLEGRGQLGGHATLVKATARTSTP